MKNINVTGIESGIVVECPVCGCNFRKTHGRKYCGRTCKDSARDRTKKKEQQKLYYERNKDELRKKARERMLAYIHTDKGKEARRRYRSNPIVKAQKKVSDRNRRNPKYDAHVRDWIRLFNDRKFNCRETGKLYAHVLDRNRWLLSLSTGDAARYWKKIGLPWKNRNLTAAQRYAVRYRFDEEFRMREINRNTWRKDILRHRNDGTVNFWKLLRERKTCPYCGKKIDKSNSVADHMDPLCHGGANGQHNITICCNECNKKKSGRLFVDWLEMIDPSRRNAALIWYKRKHGHGPEHNSLCFTFS